MDLRSSWLPALLVLAVFATASTTRAQDTKLDLTTPRPTVPVTPLTSAAPAPAFRIELLASLGLGVFAAPAASYSRGIGALAIDLRIAGRGGDGALVRGTYGTDVWGQGYGVDADYLHRVRFAGNDSLNGSLDLMIGVTACSLDHNDTTIPAGFHVGPNAGVSIDLRAGAFVLDLGVQYRLLFPDHGAPDGGATGPAHVLTATIGIGFGVEP